MEIEGQKSKSLLFISSSNDAQHSPQLMRTGFPGYWWKENVEMLNS